MANYVRDELAARPPDELALIELTAAGERRSWTFGALVERSARLAARFSAAGVGRGDVVLTLLGNRVEYPLAMLACLRIGAVLLPCSEQLRPGDLRLRAASARPRLALCAARNRVALDGADPAFEVLTVPDDVPLPLDPAPGPPYAELAPHDPALMLFTSGTTGPPKRVTHAQRYITGQGLQARHWLGAEPGELVWSTAAPGWSKSARNSFLAPWACGAVALLADQRFAAADRLATIAAQRVAVLCMAPTEYRMIAAAGPIVGTGSVRRAVTAGEALGTAVVEAWHAQTGLVIADGYGQTETGHVAGVRPGEVAPPGSMGRPLPGVLVEIVDGELCVDPASVPTFFLGYDGRPASAGLWHTGDLVRRDERGWLYFLARADDVIASAGYRIGPAEVESALLGHLAVAEVAVIGVPDEVRGQLVCAVVALRAGFAGSPELVAELQRHTREQTAPYKYPRRVEFVDELPKTTSGKIARGQLRAAYGGAR